MSSYVSITGKINYTTYNSVRNTTQLTMGLAGVVVGNTVNIDNYVDATIIGTQQSFAIPKADLGISSQTVDEMTLNIIRAGGPPPTVTFDDIQIENTGGTNTWAVEPNDQKIIHVYGVYCNIVDAYVTTLASNSIQSLEFDKILALTALSTGINFQKIVNGVTKDVVIFKQLSDFISAGFNITTSIADANDAMIHLEQRFPIPFILDSRTLDKFVMNISEDLSGLTILNFSIFGAEEDYVDTKNKK